MICFLFCVCILSADRQRPSASTSICGTFPLCCLPRFVFLFSRAVYLRSTDREPLLAPLRTFHAGLPSTQSLHRLLPAPLHLTLTTSTPVSSTRIATTPTTTTRTASRGSTRSSNYTPAHICATTPHSRPRPRRARAVQWTLTSSRGASGSARGSQPLSTRASASTAA